MKTLKSVLAGIALLFVCVAANAAVKPVTDALTRNDVVNIYIDAITKGNTSDLGKVLDDSFHYDMQRGDNVNSLNKGQLLDYLKNNTATDASVTTTTSIVQEDIDVATIKVEFKYSDYTRVDRVTLTKGNDWMITGVTTSTK